MAGGISEKTNKIVRMFDTHGPTTTLSHIQSLKYGNQEAVVGTRVLRVRDGHPSASMLERLRSNGGWDHVPTLLRK